MDSVTGKVWHVDEFGGPYADDDPLQWGRVIYDDGGHQVGVPHIVVAPSFSDYFMAERQRLFES